MHLQVLLSYDITRDIMTKVALARLKRRMESLRGKAANIRTRELVGLAQALGRRRVDRGSEPTYVSDPFPTLRPATIPSHSKPLKKYTALSVLNQLEEDVSAWDEALLRAH